MTFVDGERQHEHADDHPVGREDPDAVVRDPAQQPRDRGVPDDEGEDRGERRGAGRRPTAVPDVAQLEEPGEDDRRDREQEGVARRRRAVEVQQEPGRDRGARAADPGDEREGLGAADEHAVAEGEVLERPGPAPAALGLEQHDAEEDHRHADELERAELVLDRVLEGEAEETDRDRAQDEVPAEPGLLRAADGGVPQPGHPALGDGPQLTAEVHEDREHRPELHDGRERGPRVLPAEEGGDDPQVGGARDGQELRQALHDPEHDGLKGIHAGGEATGRRGRRGRPPGGTGSRSPAPSRSGRRPPPPRACAADARRRP